MNLDEWSSQEVKLPCSGRQLKCCPLQDKLFILNINNKCGYTFDPINRKWTTLIICDKNNILPSYSKLLTLCYYKSSLFIKGILSFFNNKKIV